MYCGKTANRKVERVQRRALRAVYNDYTSTYNQLLKKGNLQNIHKRNLNILIVEVYKCINKINPSILWDTFSKKKLKVQPANFQFAVPA